MPNVKQLISRVKSAFNSYLLKSIKINGLSLDSHIEKEAQRRSLIWQRDKDNFASAYNRFGCYNLIKYNYTSQIC